jgi:hypothetical protein
MRAFWINSLAKYLGKNLQKLTRALKLNALKTEKEQVCFTKTYECMIHFCTFLSEFSFNKGEIFRVCRAIKGASMV